MAESSLSASAGSDLSILIVDQDASCRETCANVLRLEGWSVTMCGSYAEAHHLIAPGSYDIVLLDHFIDGAQTFSLLSSCIAANANAIVIVTAENPTISSSVKAISAGAWAYLPKPFSANHLQILVGRAADAIMSRNGRSSEYHNECTNGGDSVALIGDSPSFVRTVTLARRAATTDASIFIYGESGTGKEQIANYIHAHSRRSHQPLVALNCAALPETLLETEMFGHVKGAFTDASRDKPGLLEVADGGTMFLDELTEMPATTQAKLLRVLQDGAVRRLGSNSVEAVVNVRFIAATNRDPRDAVKSGVLREDLYYRLRIVPIRIPPLRERPEDIPLLANYFLRLYWERHREPGAVPPRFSPEAVHALQARAWRGNVRELQNVIEHSVVLLTPGSVVQPEDLPAFEAAPDERPQDSGSNFSENEGYYASRDRVVVRFERSYLKWLVNRAKGNMSMAARIAGVDRTTLYRLMEKHSVRRDTVITIR